MGAEMSGASDRMVRKYIAHLAIADPDAAQRMHDHLVVADPSGYVDQLARVVEEVIDALALEVSFGRQLADGMGRLMAKGAQVDLQRYRRLVHAATASGPTLAGLFAKHLVPILIRGNTRMVDRFEETTRIMLQKGTYTLKAPLEALSKLIEEKDMACAHAFLDLLATTYALDISYNRTVYLTHTLPRAVDGFEPIRRLWQIRGLARVLRENERLADEYLRGLALGLHLLSETALGTFLDQAIRRYQQDPDLGARFLSLESQRALAACRELQVSVPLSAMRPALERYLNARTGLAVSIRPLSSLSEKRFAQKPATPLVHCDGQTIYLPDEMDLMEHRSENAVLFKLLVRLEASAIEFGTYELDAQKAFDTGPVAQQPIISQSHAALSELDLFLSGFQQPMLALDLFTLFEHARIVRKVSHHYPGLSRQLIDALNDGSLQARTGQRTGGTLFPLYRHLVMGKILKADRALMEMGRSMAERLSHATRSKTDTVEASGRLAIEFYSTLLDYTITEGVPTFQPLSLPFGRRLEPAAFGSFNSVHRRLASDIRDRLAKHNLRAYRSDLQRLLLRQNGQVSVSDIRTIIVSPDSVPTTVDLSWLDLEALVCSHCLQQPANHTDTAGAFRYREWDWCMGDYLPDRVRVSERKIHAADTNFYRQTLNDFSGLVKRIRYAFERLRPEEMTILRQWREGDAFDYRALLDYAMDRKAGLMPSDRLFVKRMKQVRDVSVLLLVDLSRSTANAVDRQGTRVLDVEKQAIVLLCEALEVVGDRFAIAGFSGTGPLGVDYYRIKNLEAAFDDGVRGRISAMAPQRSTRMGAAIRHAAAQLSAVQARVRLILILGDGFPNDLAYKGPYAVEDTRRAIMEARAKAIHVKAITVNVSDNRHLDRLYGAAHHTLIGNIRDLPDKLVRVYSALTRH